MCHGAIRTSSRLPRARGDRPAATARSATTARGFPAPAGIDPLVAAAGGGISSGGFPAPAGIDPWSHFANRQPRSGFPAPAGIDPWQSDSVDLLPGFPAPAGIDPSNAGSDASHPGLPRARGDRPLVYSHSVIRGLRLPRARGDRPDSISSCRPIGIGFPAPAGIDPGSSSWKRRRSELGFPAPAGIDPIRRIRGSLRGGLPRARGDRPFLKNTYTVTPRASPRPRG